MSIKEDVKRALQYGRDAYYHAIQAVPSYQHILAKVRTDYNERTWIDFEGFYPKFPGDEFEKRRQQYQAKYGSTINVPGFNDVIHLAPKATISAEERAAHLWAIERKLPSPLTPAQLETLKYKKFRFLKALASPTPTWMRTAGAVATTLDNAEDALVTIAVLGRIAAKIAPRLTRRLIPGLGWILTGSDILNLANVMSWATFASNKAKRNVETLAERNPFHAKAKARRTLKLKRTWPTFGETLEILQTTDQVFGYGLCLGALVGMLEDTAAKIHNPEKWQAFDKIIQTGNANEIARWVAQEGIDNFTRVKRDLINLWTSFKDDGYRIRATDIELQRKVNTFVHQKVKDIWGWIKTPPPPAATHFSNTLIGSMIMSTTKDDFLDEDHTKAYMMLDQAIRGLIPWWIENDPLTNFKELRDWQFRAPSPWDPTTLDMLNELTPGWSSTIKWPHLETEYATIEEITFTYAPLIKDSFQTYALNHSHEYDAMIAGQQIVEFTKDVIRAYDDEFTAITGMTAWWAVGEDMMREIYLIPPDAPKEAVNKLQDYIGQHERQTAQAPPIAQVAAWGTSLGIDWMRSFPGHAFPEAAEIFPEWSEIQEQLDELYIPD